MSGIYLPASDEASIQRQLSELDDRLILTRECDQRGRNYYVVIYYQGGSQPPEIIEDWREGNGQPRPLNSALPNVIRKMMGEGGTSLAAVMRHNENLKERRAEEMEEHYRETALDVQRSDRRSAMLPRGVSLQRARERERRRLGK